MRAWIQIPAPAHSITTSTAERARALRKLSVKYAPYHLYMFVLNYLMPERVGEKSEANRAYPIGGEYVADVDIHLF